MRKRIKKVISSLMATALVITGLSTAPVAKASTSSIEVDGIIYEFIGIEDGKYAENVVITSTNISSSSIEVPEELDGYKVNSIGSPQQQFIKNDQFSTKNKSISITIKAATEIYNEAFKDVTRLKEITLPESLKIIGDGAFSNTSLQEVILPESLETIGDRPFADVNELDIQLLNPNTYFTEFTKWNINGTHGYDNSTANDFAQISGITYTTLNDYNETDTYISSTLSLNMGSIVKEEMDEETGEISEKEEVVNIEDAMQYNESFPALSTKVYLKPNYKVPSLKTLPSYEHYTFKGYAVEGVLFYDENGTPIVDNVDECNTAFGDDYFTVKDNDIYTTELIDDLSLTAVWEPCTYNVIFDSNAEYAFYETPLGKMETKTLTYNKYEVLNKNQFSQTGYEFSGWNTRRSGYGDSYSDEAFVTNLIKKEWESGDSITLYAQWKEKTYKIEYNLNGGTLEGEIESERTFPTAVSLPKVTKDGYIFDGWVDENGDILTEIAAYTDKDVKIEAKFTKEDTDTPGSTNVPETTVPTETTTVSASASPATNTPEVTVTPSVTDSPEATVAPSVTDSPEVTITPSATNSPEVTTTPSATNSPEVTATPSVTNSPTVTAAEKNIVVNIKNKKTYKKTKKVIIKAPNGIKTVKLNSKKLSVKKGNKKYTFKIKKFKKYLKKKGWNKLLIIDKKNKKKTIKFKVK
ncbi:MAG: leucine-rich repeat protein [Butyrivibrio sp.]|nr:leucine-rich repeat protein [Butyrivibrio sp.]